jgi:hypothetical protein
VRVLALKISVSKSIVSFFRLSNGAMLQRGSDYCLASSQIKHNVNTQPVLPDIDGIG